nr:hypothetical protein [Tanacetum cinerariifolium]
MINRRVSEALEAQEINKNLGIENKNGNRNGNGGNGNGNRGNGSVMATEPTRLRDNVCIANNMMDKKLKGYDVRSVENKRRLDVNRREDHGQKPPFKRHKMGGQNFARAYTADNNETRGYEGPQDLPSV